ncbi:MAG: TOBE domain-containing protein [Alcaligenaceae bacterium]|nr:TOBE domain-containing protein [Alcaligenaceae bacterium]
MSDIHNKQEIEGIHFGGRFWIERHSKTFLGPGRIELLEKIQAGNSIAEAARQLGMGYKTAWDMLNDMNHLADEPLVISIKGGRRGGGTTITEYGQKMIAFFRRLESEYQAMLISLEQRYPELIDFTSQVSPRLQLRTSARNQLSCKIQALEKKGHRILATLDLGGQQYLQAILTQKSIDEMKLSIGQQIFALIKAPMVMLSTTPDTDTQKHMLEGTLESIHIDEAGGAELDILLKSGQQLIAITEDAALAPACGSPIYAMVDPKQVIIATF